MFTIRDYAPEDFEHLWKLDQICFAEGIAYSREELRHFLNRQNSVRLVVQRDTPDSIAGFLVADIHRVGTAHIITIDVHPDARRSGLGSRLMSMAEQRLQASQCNKVLLEVAVDNMPAISFYKQHGYSVLKTLPRYYNNSIDALLLGKRLDGA